MNRKLILPLICALAVPVLGGGTSRWTHTSEADFRKGKFQNVVATNLGDLKLSRAVKTLLEQEPRVSSVYALAEGPDGTIYAGTGPQGVVLAVKGEKVSTLLKLEDENVFSLLIDKQGRLLIGTGGEKGRILRIDKPDAKPAEIFTADAVQYIWQMRQTPDGAIYAATGPNGQLFEIKPDDSHSVLFDADDSNILALAITDGDLLYAGTDPSGLIYKINRKDKSVFVLYDAPETEITALVLDARGNLYASTGQASETDTTAPETAAAEKAGRPEGGESVTPLPSPTPKDPDKPKLPDPKPTEPDPIPKKLDLMVIDDKALPSPSPGTPGEGRGEGRASQANDPTAEPIPPTPPTRAAVATAALPQPANPNPATPPGEGAAQGNAIYKIDPEGFVTEVFRQPVMVLSMVEKDGVLLAGTGSDGLIYQINPAAEETIVLAKVDPKQVMSMLPVKDGRLILGLANVGGLASLSSGFATEGSYTSPVLDAAQISRFGKMHLTGSLPSGSKLTVSTRSGNLQEPGETTWSKWSDETPAAAYVQIAAPAARFLQYRLSFASADGNATAIVDEVDTAYAAPNLAPQIKSIKITGPADEAAAVVAAAPNAAAPPKRVANPIRTITWEAIDPNADAVEYTLFFRSGTRGTWIQLQDKLATNTHNWDTKLVPDGRYFIRVVASDAKANPKGTGRISARVSDPIVIDNTPPAIGNLKLDRLPKGAKIELTATDRTSTVASVDYAIDSKDDWQAVASSDSIFDSPEEGVVLTLDDLAAGAHQVMLRATDEFGNQSFETVQVTVDAK